MSWHGLTVYGLGFELPTADRSAFPGYRLRGLLGRALFDAVCLYAGQRDDRACGDCALNTRCAYPLVFKPVDPARLPPYWLHCWEQCGSRLRCTWHVLAAARPHLEAWLFGLQRHVQRHGLGSLKLWDAASGTPLILNSTLKLDRLQPLANPRLPDPECCFFQSLTPLVSKHRGDPLYGALRTRTQRLIQYYGDGFQLPIEDRPWETAIESARVVDLAFERRILHGSIYRLRLTRLSPAARELLAHGQWWHAGGHATVGCGAYRLEPIGADQCG